MLKKYFLYIIFPMLILLIFVLLFYTSSNDINREIIQNESHYDQYIRLYRIGYDKQDIQNNNKIQSITENKNNIMSRSYNAFSNDDRVSIAYMIKSFRGNSLKKRAHKLAHTKITKGKLSHLFKESNIYKHRLRRLRNKRKEGYIKHCNLQSIFYLLIILIICSCVFAKCKYTKIVKFIQENRSIFNLSEVGTSYIFNRIKWCLISDCLYNIINEYLLFTVPLVISVMSGIFGDINNGTAFYVLSFLSVPSLSFIQFFRIYYGNLRSINRVDLDELSKLINNTIDEI